MHPLAILFTSASIAAGANPGDPAGNVNVFIGTSNEGYEFPGAVSPFGMAAFSPEETPLPGRTFPNAAANGYEWRSNGIRGFSLTHMMGAGCEGAGGDIPFMPVTMPIELSPELPVAANTYTSLFSHEHERASPGAYAVLLGNGVGVDLAATPRTGIARFAFPAQGPANLLIRPSASEVGSSDARIQIDAAHRTVSGSVTSGNFCGQSPQHRVSYYKLHFVAVFDQPFAVGGTWVDGVLRPGTTQAAGGTGYGDLSYPPIGRGSGGWLSFAPGTAVTARIGISYVDDEGARKNLSAEAPSGLTVTQAQTQARTAWNDLLGRITVEGGTPAERRVFTTALYHAVIHPTLLSDTDGRYAGFDRAVHRLSAFQHAQYGNFSGWDVYRSQVQLVTLLDPRVGSDFAQSLLNQADQNGGTWDRWTHITGATSVMNGDPSAPAVAAIRAFGGRWFDLRSAYASLLKAATVPTPLESRTDGPITGYGQRPGLDRWLVLHYLPVGAPSWGAASSTLEYAAADFGVAQLARQAGDRRNEAVFLDRAGWWRNLYNPHATSTEGFIQPRAADGSWPSFDPASGSEFTEGSGAQYLWMVPHDPAGLFQILGGRDAARARLDRFFHDAAGNWAVTNASPLHPELGNEPSIASPWLFDFLGQPWKTQAAVRAAMTQIWRDEPTGISGNDDLGEMSSWYVWSALGLYPVWPGRAELVIGSPLFPAATVRRPDGTVIRITAPAARADRPFVQALTLNGRSWAKPWLPSSFVARGGALGFELGDQPNEAWGAADAAMPPSFGPGSAGRSSK